MPPPLTQIELRYPDNLGLGLSGLGLATCTAQILEASGPSGCPPNSVMGYGAAFTGIVLGATTITESAPITILRSPDQEGHLAVLFCAEGTAPVNTRIVFPGLLLPAPAPFGGLVSVGVPLVPTLPGAPYISVIRLRATIGPEKVTYYEQAGGTTLAYRPKGILLPRSCPGVAFRSPPNSASPTAVAQAPEPRRCARGEAAQRAEGPARARLAAHAHQRPKCPRTSAATSLIAHCPGGSSGRSTPHSTSGASESDACSEPCEPPPTCAAPPQSMNS